MNFKEIIQPFHWFRPAQMGHIYQLNHLKRYKKRHRLYTIVPSVHVIPHEEVIGVRGLSTNLEQLHQVVELPVHISAHGNRALHRLYK